MNELTDLEICKRIAEIEGLPSKGFEVTPYRIGKLVSAGKFVEWNPLTDKALCFDLMIKYEVNLVKLAVEWKASIINPINKTNVVSNKNPQRAICLAIIAKHK